MRNAAAKRWSIALICLLLLFLCACSRQELLQKPVTGQKETLPEQLPQDPVILPEETQPQPEEDVTELPVLEADHQITLQEGFVLVYEEEAETKDGSLTKRRDYASSNGDHVVMGRVQTQFAEELVLETLLVEQGSLQYYDSAGDQWVEQTLTEGVWNLSMVLINEQDGGSLLIYLPKVYACRENASLEYLPQLYGSLWITPAASGWQIELRAQTPEETAVCDYTLVQSDEPLLDWSDPNCGDLWKRCTMETIGMWCFDGFYRSSPSTYVPSGDNYYYRCPASYLIKVILDTAQQHPAGENLAIAMLDTVARTQNLLGFWETGPQSGWLAEDYNIAAGFYDTRFNTDLVELYIRAYQSFGGNRFREIMERYADFYLRYADKHHFEASNGGWYVEDYYHPDGNDPVHSSLNHHAAEAITMYRLSELLSRPELAELADRMVLAIRDHPEAWVTDAGDLHYCIYPDGTYGRPDYPYLTYNDLFDLQQLLLARNGTEDPYIQYLMDAKRRWMDANGVDQYKQ